MPPPSVASSRSAPAKVTAPKFQRKEVVFAPPRIVLNAVEGWGKTTFGAHAPGAGIVMAAGENGYETLLSAKLVPLCDSVTIDSWSELLAIMDDLGKECPYKTLVFDALGGFERQCHEFVCKRDFDNDFGPKGFTSYNKGFDVAVTDWLGLLSRLEKIHSNGIGIVLLSHCKIKTFKNPLGEDFDRYISDVHEKTWAVTVKWADAVFFGNYYTITDKKKGELKAKGIGGNERVLYTERRDAFDAKNRYGMVPEIEIPNDPSKVWETISNEITKGARA